MVGQKFLEVLEERNLPIDKFLCSHQPVLPVKPSLLWERHNRRATPSCFDNKDIDIALFSAGGYKTYAPIAVKRA